MAQSKVKSKTKTGKAKTKTKAKVSASTKTKKAKTKKTKSVAKAKLKAKTASKKKLVAKPKATKKIKTIKTAKHAPSFTTAQKAELVIWIEQIIDIHRATPDGLRSLDAIDQILNPYNQKFTTTVQKFDAIVELGMHKHEEPMAVVSRGKEVIALFKALDEIYRNKTNFHDAKEIIHRLYTDLAKDRKNSQPGKHIEHARAAHYK
ncbi:MAG: hypothetical protein ABI597_07335 [Gammaproteobacteria bacterium]